MMPQKTTEKTPEDLLWEAIARRNYAAAEEIFEKHPALDVDHKRDGKTLFQMSILWHDLQLADYLLHKGADINAKSDPHGFTSLMLAVRIGAPGFAAVKFLIDNDAGINLTCLSGQTALHHAANVNAHKVVTLLADAGADLDARNDMRMTALYLAAKGGFQETVEILLAAGADETITEPWSLKTPREVAATNRNAFVRGTLEEIFKRHAETPSPAGEKRIRAATAEKTASTLKKVKSISFVKKTGNK